MKFYFIFPLILQKLIWIPTRLVLLFFGKLEINGLDNLKGIDTPVIFACNHASEIDPFLVPASLPIWSRFSPIFYATREKAFYDTNGWRKHLFGGFFINMWGGYTAQVGLHDYEKSLHDHIRILREGGSFCVFPEGGISHDEKIKQAKGGVAYLAERGRCVVVPVAISGAYNMSNADFFLRRRTLSINFGLAITQNELQKMVLRNTEPGSNSYKAEAEYIMVRIGEMIKPIPSNIVQVSKEIPAH